MGDSSWNGIVEFRLEIYGVREIYSGEVLVTHFNNVAILTRCLNSVCVTSITAARLWRTNSALKINFSKFWHHVERSSRKTSSSTWRSRILCWNYLASVWMWWLEPAPVSAPTTSPTTSTGSYSIGRSVWFKVLIVSSRVGNIQRGCDKHRYFLYYRLLLTLVISGSICRLYNMRWADE
jgi:hypothetical protein